MNKLKHILDTEKYGNYYLMIIIAISIFLRLPGINMSLPYFLSDGGDVVTVAYKMIVTHDFDYKLYNHGGCFYYISSMIFYIFFLIEWILKGFSVPLSEIISSYSISSDTTLTLFYLSKYISLSIGLSTIMITYFIALKMFGRNVALLSTFLLAIHPFHIFQSQSSNVDMCLLLWVLLGFYYSIMILNSGNIKYYILCGLFTGLSISTKYFIFSCLPLLFGHFLYEKKQDKLNYKMLFNNKLLISFYIAIITFLISNPVFITKFYEIIKNISGLVLNVIYVQRPSSNIYNSFIINIIQKIVFSSFVLNIAFFILFIYGMIIILINDRDYGIILVSFPAFYLIFFILFTRFDFPQYLLPVIPFVLIASSYVIFKIKIKYVYSNVVIVILILGLIFSFSDIIIPHYRTIFNTNLQLGKWIDSKIKEGKTVYLPNLFFPTPYLLKNDKFIYYKNGIISKIKKHI